MAVVMAEDLSDEQINYLLAEAEVRLANKEVLGRQEGKSLLPLQKGQTAVDDTIQPAKEADNLTVRIPQISTKKAKVCSTPDFPPWSFASSSLKTIKYRILLKQRDIPSWEMLLRLQDVLLLIVTLK